MLRLHCFSQSGNAYKVAFMLRALGGAWEPVFVDFMAGVTRTAAWREQVNEMGEVPVLEDDGRRLTQSAVILLHLAKRFGRYGGVGEEEQQEVLRWLFFDNHKFTSYLASYRFMKSFGPQAPDAAVLAWLRPRMDNAFGIVDRHLSQRPWMVGDSPTVADFSLCGYLFYPEEESGYPIAGPFPHIGRWLDRLRQVPGWGLPYDILPGERIAPRW